MEDAVNTVVALRSISSTSRYECEDWRLRMPSRSTTITPADRRTWLFPPQAAISAAFITQRFHILNCSFNPRYLPANMQNESLVSRISGCYIPIPTLFRDDTLDVQLAGMRRHVRFLVEGGAREGQPIRDIRPLYREKVLAMARTIGIPKLA